jgi:hypothetical protein
VVAASAVVVSTGVVVSMGEVSAVAVSAGEASVGAVSTGEAFVVANSVQCEADTCSAAAVSTGVAFVVAVLVAATSVAIFAITDFLMMSSSATSAFRGGGAIRTDITVTTRTITMDTATMGTAGTGTTVAPGTVTTMAPVMDTAMAADQGIFGVCGGGDKRAPRRLGSIRTWHRKIPPMRSGSEDGRKQLFV